MFMKENIVLVSTNYLDLTDNQFNPQGYWEQPLDMSSPPQARDLALFDQNGYDLTDLEQRYAKVNKTSFHAHREHRHALKAPGLHSQIEWKEPFLITACYLSAKGIKARRWNN